MKNARKGKERRNKVKRFFQIVAGLAFLAFLFCITAAPDADAQYPVKIKKFSGSVSDTISVVTSKTFTLGNVASGAPQLSNFSGSLQWYSDIGVFLSVFTVSASDSLKIEFQTIDYFDSLYNVPFLFNGRVISSGATIGSTVRDSLKYVAYVGGGGAQNVVCTFPDAPPMKKLIIRLTGLGAAGVDHRLRLSAVYRSKSGAE